MFEDLAAVATSVCQKATANASVALDGESYRVFWEDQYLTELGVASSGPRAGFLDADGAELEEDAVITKGSVQYRIKAVEPDGMGLTFCSLIRLSDG